MEYKTGKDVTFEPTELLLSTAAEVIDGAEASNYEQAIKLGGALGAVYAREHKRLSEKYGEEHPRTQQAKLRLGLSIEARKALFERRAEVTAPSSGPEKGWTVDGFVKAVDGAPAENVTVAVYDGNARRVGNFPASLTDKKGYFSIAVEELPEKEMRVFVWASIGQKILRSNENGFVPTAGGSERITISLEDEGKDVYKTTPNVKIDPSQTKSAPPEPPVKKMPDNPKPPN